MRGSVEDTTIVQHDFKTNQVSGLSKSMTVVSLVYDGVVGPVDFGNHQAACKC